MIARMLGIPPSAAELGANLIQVTPHAKKLEDARLALNQVITEGCTHKCEMETHKKALDMISGWITSEKETAIKKASKEFAESQAKAEEQHKEQKAVLEKEIERNYAMEKSAIDVKIRGLEFKVWDQPRREKAALRAYHTAEMECAEKMNKRKIELEMEAESKRPRMIHDGRIL
jgi:hypothetical protein